MFVSFVLNARNLVGNYVAKSVDHLTDLQSILLELD